MCTKVIKTMVELVVLLSYSFTILKKMSYFKFKLRKDLDQMSLLHFFKPL